MKLLLRSLATLIAGSLAVGGFHPFELWIMPLLSLMGLILLIRGVARRERLLLAYLYGLGFLLPLLQWSSTYVGSLPWLILSFGFAAFFAPLAYGFGNGQVIVLRFSLLFLLSESLRALIPFGGFGWGRYGFSQIDGPLQHWLRIGGVSLTGFMVAFVAAVIIRRGRELFLLLPIVLVGAVSILPNAAAGEIALDQEPVRIGLIQGGVSQLGLDFNATPKEVLNRHLDESERLLRQTKVDFILWPENASDIDPVKDIDVRQRIDSLIDEHGVPFVIGAVTQSNKGPENVSILFDGSSYPASIYQKRDLVPFGEYVPLRDIAEFVSPLAETIRDFVPGESIVTHSISGVSFAPLICYELLDDRITWENVMNSSLGVVQTNNATFGRSWQSGQQFQMTRVRAFESQIPFVVAATTGDTAMIDGNGQVVERLAKYEQSHLVVDVLPSTPRLPPLGPEFLLVLAIVSLSAMAARHYLINRRSRHEG